MRIVMPAEDLDDCDESAMECRADLTHASRGQTREVGQPALSNVCPTRYQILPAAHFKVSTP